VRICGDVSLLALLGGAAAWPRCVLAQATGRRALIAWLWGGSQSVADGYVRAGKLLPPFLEGMRELGYTEGRDFDMAYRFADGDYDRMPTLAAELANLNPNVLIAPATVQAVAIKKATTTIPIVVPALADAVGLGLVASEARPGGNLTGVSPYVAGLPGKQLELAREIVPGAIRIGLLDDPTDPKAHPQRREIEAGGQELRVKVVAAEARTAGDIGAAYETFSAERVQVVIVEQSVMLINARKQTAEVAAAKKLLDYVWEGAAQRMSPTSTGRVGGIMLTIRMIAAVAALVAAIAPATAQNWPTRPVTMVYPFGAGSAGDVLGRIFASRSPSFWANRCSSKMSAARAA
jgi:putative ABC transport system substrate-binding protein